MRIARAIRRLSEALEKLPGIGPKTAQRLTFYLLHNPQSELDSFAAALANLKKDTKECRFCFNVAETDPCPICTNRERLQDQICVVENPLEILVIEKGGFYHGLYHVLGGAISPLNNLGPDELHIYDLVPRVKTGKITEIILATNPNMEGEATAMFIAKMLAKYQVKLTRIGRGLPIGADIEYADELTLQRAMEGRIDY